MRKPLRRATSFSIDGAILDYLERTRAPRSRSERVNELLRRAISDERQEALAQEAAEFFAAEGKAERSEARAFARASRRSITRAEDG